MNKKATRQAKRDAITLSQTVSADTTLDNLADAKRHLALGVVANMQLLALGYESATKTGRKSKRADADLQRSHEVFESVVREYAALGRSDAAARQAARRLITVGFVAFAQREKLLELSIEDQSRWILATRAALRTTDTQTAEMVESVKATLLKEWRADPAAVMRAKVKPRSKSATGGKGKGKGANTQPAASSPATPSATPSAPSVPAKPVVGSSDPATVPTWKGLMQYLAALEKDGRNGLASKDDLFAISDADRIVAKSALAILTAVIEEDTTRRELATAKPVTPARAPRKSRKAA